VIGLALALSATIASHPRSGRAGPARSRVEHADPSRARPRDPNDAPFLAPPAGQPPRNTELRLREPYTPRRRIQLTLLPAYAALHLDFIGRPSEPIRGGGAGVAVDIQLLDFLWIQVQGGHTIHPVQDEFVKNEDVVQKVAAAGNVMATQAGLGLLHAIDLGRFLPFFDAGVGAMIITSPTGVQDGQRGSPCRGDGSCDTGLVCGSDDVCRPGLVPEIHAGLGLDILIGDRLAVGAYVRYHALLRDPATFPVYLVGAARLALRF
jgi:hypothetical protein